MFLIVNYLFFDVNQQNELKDKQFSLFWSYSFFAKQWSNKNLIHNSYTTTQFLLFKKIFLYSNYSPNFKQVSKELGRTILMALSKECERITIEHSNQKSSGFWELGMHVNIVDVKHSGRLLSCAL